MLAMFVDAFPISAVAPPSVPPFTWVCRTGCTGRACRCYMCLYVIRLLYSRSPVCLQVVRLAERRLRRLQHLYLGQFDRLQHVLKTKRRAYLLEVAREKETMSE